MVSKKHGILLFSFLVIFIITSQVPPSVGSTTIEWVRYDDHLSSSTFYYRSKVMFSYPNSQDIFFINGASTGILNSTFHLENSGANVYLYHFNETYALFDNLDFGSDTFGLYNPLSNATYIIDGSFRVWSYNSSYQIDDKPELTPYYYSTWINHTSPIVDTNSPAYKIGTRNGYSMALDYHNEIIMFFGGDGDKADTWIFNLNDIVSGWQLMTPSIHPSYREYYSLIYEPNIRKFIFYGGINYYEVSSFDDVWEYNATGNLWEEITTFNKPLSRYNHNFIYDSINGVMLIYDGYNRLDGINKDLNRDLWSYNPLTRTWTFLKAGGGPGSHNMLWIMYEGTPFMLGSAPYRLFLNLDVPPPTQNTEISFVTVTETQSETITENKSYFDTVTDEITVTKTEKIEITFSNTTLSDLPSKIEDASLPIMWIGALIILPILIRRKTKP